MLGGGGAEKLHPCPTGGTQLVTFNLITTINDGQLWGIYLTLYR